jgi:hypothetical protein
VCYVGLVHGALVIRTAPIAALLLLAPLRAWAEPVRADIGLGVGAAVDLPDRASNRDTRLGVGAIFRVPIRVHLTPVVALRLDLDLEGCRGVDQLTWDVDADGLVYRVQDDNEHHAYVVNGLFDLGVDLTVPVRGRTRPMFGLSGGVAVTGVFHALRGSSVALLDPAVNDVGDTSNLDPYTSQVAPWAAVDVGLTSALAPRVDLWVTAGYGAAFFAPRGLHKALPALDARREAFAWNPVRAAIGVSFRLGRTQDSHPVPAQVRP